MNNYANLVAAVRGIELTTYQKSLAKDELSYLLTENKMLTEALAEADKKNKELSKLLNLCEGTCETHEEIGQEQHEKIKELLFALRDLADYYLFEKELDTDELVDMTNKVEIILEKNKHFE
jgi:hypothetical protein